MNAQQIADKLKQLSIQEDALVRRLNFLQPLSPGLQRTRELARISRQLQKVRGRIAVLEARQKKGTE